MTVVNQNNRQLRVANLIRKELVEIMAKNEAYIDYLELYMPIISHLSLGKDLKLATIYFAPHKYNNDLLQALRAEKNRIRKILAQKIKMRYVPDLVFLNDDEWEAKNRIDSLLYHQASNSN